MAPSFSKFQNVNLVEISPSVKRAGAVDIVFEYNGKVYEIGFELNYGDLRLGVAIKLIRQYFAKRTDDSTTVSFKNIPVSSPEDLQNINITIEFTPNDVGAVNFPKFEYTICNTDTNIVIADGKCDQCPEPCDYVINPNECNICDPEDYIFDAADFDDEDSYKVYY
jgi:hypothetical protein